MVHNSMCRVALHLICKQKTTYQGKCYMMHGVITRWILTENLKPPWSWRDRRGETRRSCNKCVELKYWSGAQSRFHVSISQTMQFYWDAAITRRDVQERRAWLQVQSVTLLPRADNGDRLQWGFSMGFLSPCKRIPTIVRPPLSSTSFTNHKNLKQRTYFEHKTTLLNNQ